MKKFVENQKSTQSAANFTTQPIQLASTADLHSEFGRWRDVERLYGIRRGKLYELINRGVIKSISLRAKGSKHGCRLIYLESVRNYLHGLLQEQNMTEPERAIPATFAAKIHN